MTELESTRLIAWGNELLRVHDALREALDAARRAVGGTAGADAGRRLLLHCRGFCTALGEHHRGEARALFPAIEAAHPELAPVLRALEQDHAMIDGLLASLTTAMRENTSTDELARHLDGIGAIMESHFAYEERQLLGVLRVLALDEDPRTVLGSPGRISRREGTAPAGPPSGPRPR